MSRMLLLCLGWQSQGNLDHLKKCVIVAAPHTSNWDLFYALLIAFDLKAGIHWMGKTAIFKKPFGAVMQWLGGLPIDRARSGNVVAQSIEMFKRNDRLFLTIAPAGTRSRVTHWKTGFYHIAKGANVPMAMGFLDYRRKHGGIGPILRATGELEDDMKTISAFYATVIGKYPLKGSDASVYIPPRDKAA